jgi:hypothetical protein
MADQAPSVQPPELVALEDATQGGKKRKTSAAVSKAGKVEQNKTGTGSDKKPRKSKKEEAKVEEEDDGASITESVFSKRGVYYNTCYSFMLNRELVGTFKCKTKDSDMELDRIIPGEVVKLYLHPRATGVFVTHLHHGEYGKLPPKVSKVLTSALRHNIFSVLPVIRKAGHPPALKLFIFADKYSTNDAVKTLEYIKTLDCVSDVKILRTA